MRDRERRKHTRVDFCTSADLDFGDGSYADCPTRNLSSKGVFVENIAERSLGERCSLVLRLNGVSERISLNMRGVVVRVTEKGIGLYFTDIDIDTFTRLRRIISCNCDDPDHLQENFLDH